jgi:hypothetical protein
MKYALLILLLWSCSPAGKEVINYEAHMEQDFGTAGSQAGEPYLFTDHAGEVYLSWIEKQDSKSKLQYSKWTPEGWATPILVAEGTQWFVNWADYPQMAAFSNGTFAASFLEKNGPGTFAYSVKITLSADGVNWSTPWTIHDDGTETEHGFVSMTPWDDNLLISWLDGRNTASEQHHDHSGHGHHGQMSLRAAVISPSGVKLQEWELDNRVCDCCQTSTSMTANGPVIIFRDRSEDEIRDLGIVRWENGAWSETQPVYMDLWKIAACPVNGPRVDAIGNDLGIAWYTGRQDKPEVKVVFSADGGESFNTPIKVDLGNTIGRVDFAITAANEGFVTWMEEGTVYGRKVSASGKVGEPLKLTETSTKRSSGFPQLAYGKMGALLAWTDDNQPESKIKSKQILK